MTSGDKETRRQAQDWRSTRTTRAGAVKAACLAALFCAGVLAGCGPRGGLYHVVRPGENLYRIGKAYGISYRELARRNKIKNPARIEVGRRLFIPGAKKAVPVNLVTPRDAVAKRRLDDPGLPADKRPFAWPVRDAVVTSPFGPRGRSFHDGIDLGAEAGSLVMAAADGEVAYADELRGYGRVIILRHRGGYATVYAHNSENLVREGQRVRRGDIIAKVGETGRTTAPNLHFEVRRDNTARNPLFYLPPVQVAADS